MRKRRSDEEGNFWAGYADCMLALFMITLLLWLLSSGLTAFSNATRGNKIAELEEQIASLKKDLEKATSEKSELKKKSPTWKNNCQSRPT